MRSFKLIVTRLHLWLGLILGVQVVLWITSGVVMSWFHITIVRGEHNIAKQEAIALSADQNFAPINGVLAQFDHPASRIELTGLQGEPVYRIALSDGSVKIADAQTGKIQPFLGENAAKQVAESDFSGNGEIVNSEFLMSLKGITEYRRPPPVWRFTFDDPEATRIYVSPETGEVTARRNRIWRIYDFFWMLHIMDYETRDDFNNPLLKVTATSALLFALSGLILVLLRLSASRYANDIRLLFRSMGRRR